MSENDENPPFSLDPPANPGIEPALENPTPADPSNPDFANSDPGGFGLDLSADPGFEPQLAPAESVPELSLDAPLEAAPSADQPFLEGGEPAVGLPETSPEMPPEESPVAAPADAPAEPAPPTDTIEQVKQFSEKVVMEKVQVPAAFPFSLLIEGELQPNEKEKILDVVSRESIGIREVDLEPQFAGNRVLIPRISEYAGVILVQALRGTHARMKFGPSDTIFSTEDSSSDSLQPGMTMSREPEFRDTLHTGHSASQNQTTPGAGHEHPAERLVITSELSLPQLTSFSVVDLVTASATLSPAIVEAESSTEYQEILENLQRELKYKAYRKGAVAITAFKILLQPLSVPSQYRLTVTGTAVRIETGGLTPNATLR